MTETMIMHMLAMADMTASMAPPMAETMAPWDPEHKRMSNPTTNRTNKASYLPFRDFANGDNARTGERGCVSQGTDDDDGERR